MSQYREGRGPLAIRPCEICGALVLHDEGGEVGVDGAAVGRAFPHHAPGGAICIGGAAISRELRRLVQRSRASRLRTSDPA